MAIVDGERKTQMWMMGDSIAQAGQHSDKQKDRIYTNSL